jgi:hypothetical protein
VSQTIHPYTVEDAIKPCEELLMLVVTCSEPDPRIDASHFFNLTAGSNSRIVKTAGGRTGTVANDLYAMDQVTKIGMVVVLQHTGEDPFGCKKSLPVSQSTLPLRLARYQPLSNVTVIASIYALGVIPIRSRMHMVARQR